jgi:hypothetical protein
VTVLLGGGLICVLGSIHLPLHNLNSTANVTGARCKPLSATGLCKRRHKQIWLPDQYFAQLIAHSFAFSMGSQCFLLGSWFFIFPGHLGLAIRGWGGANPVARRGYYHEIVAKFGYGHKMSLCGHNLALGGQAVF